MERESSVQAFCTWRSVLFSVSLLRAQGLGFGTRCCAVCNGGADVESKFAPMSRDFRVEKFVCGHID